MEDVRKAGVRENDWVPDLYLPGTKKSEKKGINPSSSRSNTPAYSVRRGRRKGSIDNNKKKDEGNIYRNETKGGRSPKRVGLGRQVNAGLKAGHKRKGLEIPGGSLFRDVRSQRKVTTFCWGGLASHAERKSEENTQRTG